MVLTPGMPLVASEAARAQAAHAARVERERETGAPGAWNGSITDPELLATVAARFAEGYVWSPSQLESYAKCPWAFFSKRLLGVEKFEEPAEDMDAATWGTILHDALDRFYTAAGERAGTPVFLRADDLEWALPVAEEALGAALAEQGSESWLGHPALRDAQRERLRRTLVEYLRWEVLEVNEKSFNRRTKMSKMIRMGVAEHEKSFSGVVLERGGVRFTYRGFIDRVERGVDEEVDAAGYVSAVDYKSGKYGVPGAKDFKRAWEDGVVLQVPLYAHALTELEPGSAIAYSEYRALKQRTSVHTLQLQCVDRKAGTIEPDEEAEAKMEQALDDAAAHVSRVRAGIFPAAPPPSCHCPNYCHAREICRIAGGPRELFG
jgi:RecB family exonuclease